MSEPDFDEIWINGSLLGSLVEGADCDIEIDEHGVSSAQLNYSCRFDKAVELAQAVAVHPVYDWLIRKKVKITREEALMARVNISFAGIEDTGDEGSEPVYALEGAANSEPIETHSKFEEVAGKWDDATTWKNGAKFVADPSSDDKGRFIGFVPTPGVPNKKAGNRSYLAGGVIYTETKTYSSESLDRITINLSKLCKIDDPPVSGFLPTLEGDANWLLFTVSAESVGKGMKLTRKWRASGENGWDTDWY